MVDQDGDRTDGWHHSNGYRYSGKDPVEDRKKRHPNTEAPDTGKKLGKEGVWVLIRMTGFVMQNPDLLAYPLEDIERTRLPNEERREAPRGQPKDDQDSRNHGATGRLDTIG